MSDKYIDLHMNVDLNAVASNLEVFGDCIQIKQ